MMITKFLNKVFFVVFMLSMFGCMNEDNYIINDYLAEYSENIESGTKNLEVAKTTGLENLINIHLLAINDFLKNGGSLKNVLMTIDVGAQDKICHTLIVIPEKIIVYFLSTSNELMQIEVASDGFDFPEVMEDLSGFPPITFGRGEEIMCIQILSYGELKRQLIIDCQNFMCNRPSYRGILAFFNYYYNEIIMPIEALADYREVFVPRPIRRSIYTPEGLIRIE